MMMGEPIEDLKGNSDENVTPKERYIHGDKDNQDFVKIRKMIQTIFSEIFQVFNHMGATIIYTLIPNPSHVLSESGSF